MTTIYSQFLKEGSLAFDIGAYVGARTDMFLELGCARVVAVEPVREYVERLFRKYSGDHRVIVYRSAVASQDGSGIIRIHKMYWPNGAPIDSALSSMSYEWIQAPDKHPEWGVKSSDWSENQFTETVTLDTLIEECGEPDFIKIDVEGYEKEVLKGLTHPVKALSFEFHSELHMDWTEACIVRLLQIGNYEFNYDLEDRMEPVYHSWLNKELLLRQLSKEKTYGDVFARRM